MKKHPFIISLCLLSSLSSCTSLFGGDGYSIASTESYIDPTTGDTIILITFDDEEIAPLKVTIPSGKAGVDGNGIKKIETTVDKEEFVITIIYTDTSYENTVLRVPITNGKDGISVTGVNVNNETEDGNVIIKFTYSDGTESPDITIPKGNDGNGIASIVTLPNEAEGTITLVISYTDGREPTRVTLTNGRDGVSIASIEYDEDRSSDDYYSLKITYDDGYTENVNLPRPKSTVWYTGVNEPDNKTGKEGDFYINLNEGKVYRKENDEWVWKFTLASSAAKNINVIFNANGGTFSDFEANFYVCPVVEGKVIPLSSFQIPVYPDHKFLGWYTSADYNPNSAKVTDMTPIYSETNTLNLYAWWSE